MKKKIAMVLVALVLLGAGFAGGYNYGKKRGVLEEQRVMGFEIMYNGPNCLENKCGLVPTGYHAFAIDNGLHYIVAREISRKIHRKSDA